jgi:ubiquinone/menaquinone biosynthesis C-methylase UbiE
MDYDLTDIPAGYDRGREHGPEFLDLWMNKIESHLDGRRVTEILDLGCGTGRFSEGLAAKFDAKVVGIDPSRKMLERAHAKKRDYRVQYQYGQAESIPLPAQSVDMIFMSMSFHHFDDKSASAHECWRVLRRKGSLFIRTGTLGQISSYPYVPFFLSSRPILEEICPDSADIRTVFEEAGFRIVISEIVTQTIARDWASYAEKLSAGGDSVLARLSPKEFKAGLAALRSYCTDIEAVAVVEPIDLFVFRKD